MLYEKCFAINRKSSHNCRSVVNKTCNKSQSDAKGLWSITWRSLVLLPFLFPLGLLWIVLVIVIGILPILALVSLCSREWPLAGILLAVWVLLVFAYRYFKLGRWFEWPPSVL